MNLRDWLYKTRITVKDFSKLVRVNRSYLHTIINGSCIPSKKILKRISEVTIGQVSELADLVDRIDGKKNDKKAKSSKKIP